MRCVKTITRETIVTVCDVLDLWPDMDSKEIHVVHVTSAKLGHERLKAATKQCAYDETMSSPSLYYRPLMRGIQISRPFLAISLQNFVNETLFLQLNI